MTKKKKKKKMTKNKLSQSTGINGDDRSKKKLSTHFPTRVRNFLFSLLIFTISTCIFFLEVFVETAECAGPGGADSGTEAHSEPRGPSAESSSAPSALDERKEELINANLEKRKGP